jgi:phosphohistidine swiveling domain-containing protein
VLNGIAQGPPSNRCIRRRQSALPPHASIIAREYGIPAVVGCGDATARLQTGMLVTVDGFTGNVEPG